MKLKYGEEELNFDQSRLTKSRVLLPNEQRGVADPLKAVKDSLQNPINSLSIAELVNEELPDKVVIIVNDVSRPTPYEYLLPPLLEELHKVGIEQENITFVIATGIHEPNTKEQNLSIFGEKLLDEYKFISHNPDENLVDLGKLSSGNRLYLNREVVEADLLITLGVILPHYFAGFSGGRKSILPGVAGRESIEYNHSHMVDLIGNLPPIEENQISQEMLEAARKAGVDFILNVVTNSNKEIVEVVAGNYKQAWQQGVNTSSEMYHVSLEEKADAAIVSAGGYPKDINFYQAQKALDNADYATKEGGTIILAAECREGLGENIFTDWLSSSTEPKDNLHRIKDKFVLGGHKAFAISKVAMKKDIILISDFDRETTEQLFAKKASSISEALDYVEEKHGQDYTSVIMPQGGLAVPVVDKE
ncbi:nickel-dependent lactate racemase [Acetohalobium arabaticum]|uniref:Uncharacterized protein n=1 Tax=Acetohalobium arabaticum (strain ATCC 49924 / DSM 5501 / Z-7288) TaxID=574087 RepID=D9QQC9_ACEAZ|nr:nickel-dependent lactate racemase [Acetohalobium arabaticum]ADL12720.1 Protein of unknown function DUF2088 [Acetohalobium arabaticum DSM 5501]